MKKIIFRICLYLIFGIFCTYLKAQTYFNKEWVKFSGTPDTIEWTASTVDQGGNLITTGNSFDSAQLANILIIKFNNQGSIDWQVTWNSPNSKSDYGIAVCTDIYNNIFIAGASCYSNDSIFDIVLIKYNYNGDFQWSNTYDGFNKNDYPLDISLDDNGNIYLTGTSEGSGSDYDYITLKFNSVGQLQWNTRYNFNNHVDIASDIVISENGTRIAVTGGSEDSTGIWHYTSLIYDENGTQLSVNREFAAEFEINNPRYIVRDQYKNYYLTAERINGSDKDIKLMKLDSTLNPVWVRYFGESYDEGSNIIASDNNGGIYIGGWQEDNNNQRNFLLLKYNYNGDLIWSESMLPVPEKPFSEITKITIQNGLVDIVGFAKSDYDCDIVTVQYNANGDILWTNTWNGIGNSIDYPSSIQQVNNTIYVSGRNETTNGRNWVTIKYSFKAVGDSVIIDTINNEHFIKDQLLIWFVPDFVNHDFIDNRNLQYARLNDILPDSVLDSMSYKTGINFQECNLNAFKLMTRMTTADSISIARNGDTIRLKPFWSVLIIDMPNNSNLNAIIDSLKLLKDYIFLSEKSYIGFLDNVPNDPLFTLEQESLFPNPPNPQFPNAHINVEPAWDIENGQDYVKVGIFDFPVFWAHPDFGDGTYAGSKIEGGWDWISNTHISNVLHPNYSSHGTSVAGIIGALRNNDEGISGIAGGDMQNGNTGVQLFSFGLGYRLIIFPYVYDVIDLKSAISSIIEGAAFNPSTGFGYGLNIENHSWSGPYKQDSTTILGNAVETCWENQCIFIASRGNSTEDANLTNLRYPACFEENMVINVGASGTNGQLFDGFNIFNGDAWFTNPWRSMFGGAIDVIAPGVTDIVASTQDPTIPWPWRDNLGVVRCAVDNRGNNNYSCFNGTSAAAPHVSGLAALMLSLHNPNNNRDPNNNYPYILAPEDVEHIIEFTATDIVDPALGYPVGRDQWNGSGRINAENALINIELPRYRVFHNLAPSNTSQTTVVNQKVFLSEKINGISPGWYNADRVQVNYTFLDVFSSTTQILGEWPRLSSTLGFSAANPISDKNWANINFTINNNVASVAGFTFCWYIKTPYGSGQTINKWIPAPPQNLHVDYTLHLFDPNASGIKTDSIDKSFSIYPNPVSNNLIINANLPESDNLLVTIYNTQGKILFQENIGILNHFEKSISVENLPASVYLCVLSGDKFHFVEKFVKK